MTTATLTNTQNCLTFFQKRIVRAVEYWLNHDAVKQLKIAYLDKEREAILKAISVGLQFEPAWPVVRALINALTSYMERRGHWDAWHEILLRAIEVAQRVGDADGEVTLTALLARLCQRQGKPEDVVRCYRRVIRLARHSENEYELARSCSNLGYHYIDSGQWWRSEILNKHALELFYKLDSSHGQAHTHNHLGALYNRLRQWEKGENHLRQALQLWTNLNDEHSIIFGLVNLGFHYVEQQDSISAIQYLSQAQKYAQKTGEVSILGTILNSKASAYRYMGKIDTAEVYARQAERIHRQFDNNLGLAQVWNNLGLIHIVKNDGGQVELFLKNSLKTYHQLGHKLGQVQVLLDMAGYNLACRDFSIAAENLSKLNELLSSQKGEMYKIYRERAANYYRSLPKGE